MIDLRRAGRVLLMIALAAATGCVSLAKPYPAITDYVIEIPRAETAPPAAGNSATILKVRGFRVAAPFDSRKFVYRRADGSWESDFYHELLVSPGPMIAGIIEQALSASGAAGQVVPASSQASPTHELEGTIQQWYADYSDPANPRAVLSIEFLLLDDRGSTRIAMHKTYREEVKLAKAGPEALVVGWGSALSAILAELETDLKASDWSAAR